MQMCSGYRAGGGHWDRYGCSKIIERTPEGHIRSVQPSQPWQTTVGTRLPPRAWCYGGTVERPPSGADRLS